MPIAYCVLPAAAAVGTGWGKGGGYWDGDTPKRLHNAPTDNTKPPKDHTKPPKSIHSPRRQYKRPTDYTKPRKSIVLNYVNTGHKLKRLNMSSK